MDANARKALKYTSGSTNRLDFGIDPGVTLNQQQLDTADNHMIFGKLSIDYNLNKDAMRLITRRDL